MAAELPELGINILPHEIMEVARAVGADVPFFLVGGRAKAEGYGEVLGLFFEREWRFADELVE